MKRSGRLAQSVAKPGIAALIVTVWLGCFYSRHEDSSPRRHALREDVVGCYALFGSHGRRVDTTYYNAWPQVRLASTSHATLSASLGGI